MPAVRAGLVVVPSTPRATVDAIIAAERHGAPAVWTITPAAAPDPLTLLAAAAMQTERVTLGTAIIQTYPRHPIVLAAQAQAVAGLAPGRFRLGVGPGSERAIQGVFGLRFGKPLAQMREYIATLRSLLWQGAVDQNGEYVTAHLQFPQGVTPPQTPILMSALRAPAYRLAGEISDGALSWVSPPEYLVRLALPALAEGAAVANRGAPSLVAHTPVALTTDRSSVHAAARAALGFYGRLPHYQRMFADAGFTLTGDGGLPDALIDALVVSGTPEAVQAGLRAILDQGIGEVMVSVLPVRDVAAETAELCAVLAEV